MNYRQRILEELLVLNVKTVKLSDYLTQNEPVLAEGEQHTIEFQLMNKQLHIMQEYCSVLKNRLNIMLENKEGKLANNE